MNHSHEPRCVATQRTWDDYPNVVLFVHVFYHETMSGLINCQQNYEAIQHIQAKLQDYCDSHAQTPSENQLSQSISDESNQSAGENSRWNFMSLPKLRLPSFNS